MSVGTELDQLLEELRSAEKLLLTTHENPDGDALGSLVAMHGVLTQLGKDALMYMSPDEFPLPIEYRDMKFEGLLGAPPEDMSERVVVFLDCGNIDRMPVDFLKHEGTHILNIDHHHDNTRFGTANLVVPDASCTAEIVYDLARELGAADHPGDRRRHVRRPGHRHRPVHVPEHHPRGAPHGRRPDRGRGGHPRRVPAPVRGPSAAPAASCSSARWPACSATTTAPSPWAR